MKWLVRLIFCALFVGTIAVPAASQGGTSEIVGWPYARSSIDPRSYTGPLDFLHLICEGLIGSYSDSIDRMPLLATSWEASDDGMTYVFHLREGVVFHDGSPFTADDVLYSFSNFEEPIIAGVDAIDDYTVQFTLTSPTPSFLARLPGYFIVSQEAASQENDFSTNPVCTGMYVVRDWQPDASLLIEANPTYWGSPPPMIL